MKYFILSLILLSSCATRTDKFTFDKELTQYKYPFKTYKFKFNSQRQNLQMTYMDRMPELGRPKGVVVLLHGKNFGGFYWRDVADLLLVQNYRVVIPDQVGFGKSSKPENYQYSFYQLIDNTRKLLQELKIEKYIVVGHSMGGMMATHFAYSHPKEVEKLILINPIGLEPYLKYVEYKEPEFFYNLEKNKTAETYREYQRKNYYDGEWADAYEELIIPYEGQMNSEDWDLLAWTNALTYGPIFTEDITTKFRYTSVPTALIIGDRDKTAPGKNWKKKGVKRKLGDYKRLAATVNAQLPKSRLYMLKDLGHMPHIEDFKRFKEVFTQALNWRRR